MKTFNNIQKLKLGQGILCVLVLFCHFSGLSQPEDQSNVVDLGMSKSQKALAFFKAGKQSLQYPYMNIQNFNRAVSMIERSADMGYAPAQHELAMIYFKKNSGVTQDYKKAFHWLQLAAQQGYVESQARLGTMYLLGLGTDQDNKKASFWIEKAHQAGSMEATLYLGWMFLKGVGGKALDIDKSVDMFQKAANHGNFVASVILRNDVHVFNPEEFSSSEKQDSVVERIFGKCPSSFGR